MIPCRDCPGVSFESQDAIVQHRRDVHPAPKPWVEVEVRYCTGEHNGRRKKRYSNVNKAWYGAWLTFARNGFVLTPYRCEPRKLDGKNTQAVCHSWHLTHSTRHVLPAATKG